MLKKKNTEIKVNLWYALLHLLHEGTGLLQTLRKVGH
jgi:hypothetical protein